MPAGRVYLLETNVLVAYVRTGPLGRWIESTYQLTSSPDKPAIDKDFDHLHPHWVEREWMDEEVVKTTS